MKGLPDNKLIRLLQSDDEADIRKAVNCLYANTFQKIMAMLRGKGASKEDAEEIFWTGIYILEENVKEKKLKADDPKSNLKGYLYKICQWTWYKKIERDNNIDTVPYPENLDRIKVEEHLVEILALEEIRDIVTKLLKLLSGNCEKIISLTLFRGLTNKEVCRILHYKSEASVKVTRNKCMKKLRKLIEDSGGRGLFYK